MSRKTSTSPKTQPLWSPKTHLTNETVPQMAQPHSTPSQKITRCPYHYKASSWWEKLWALFIILPCGGFHHVGHPERPCCDPRKGHRENIQWCSADTKLFRHPTNIRRQIKSERYDSVSPQWFIIIFGEQGIIWVKTVNNPQTMAPSIMRAKSWKM